MVNCLYREFIFIFIYLLLYFFFVYYLLFFFFLTVKMVNCLYTRIVQWLEHSRIYHRMLFNKTIQYIHVFKFRTRQIKATETNK